MSLASQQPSAAASGVSSRKWLREASMRRLSLLMKDKTEVIGSAHKLKVTLQSMEGLERSGLNEDMIRHLQAWVDGLTSGRQCMMAILDCHQMEQSSKQANPSTSNTDKSKAFQPLDLIRTALSLPEQFFCDAGDLYETVFGRPPANVIKEAFQVIADKAYENSSSALGLQQINLALKQLQLDALCVTPLPTSPKTGSPTNAEDADSKENTFNQQAPIAEEEEDNTATGQKKGYDTLFRTKITIELIRIHINKTILQQQDAKSNTPSTNTNSNSNSFIDNNSIASSSSKSSSTTDAKPSSNQAKVIMNVIHTCLDTPLAEVHKDALTRSPEELESTNNLLKPYLRRLATLKASLASQLHELRDSRAFLALGLSSANVSEDEIKKAYRSLAIRYHPDKPGGDTVKFQQLQVWYQEVLKKKKSMSAEEDAMAEMTTKFRSAGKSGRKPAPSNPANKASSAMNPEDSAMFEEVDKDIFPETKTKAKSTSASNDAEAEDSSEEEKVSQRDDDEPDKESEPLDDEIDSLLEKTKDIQRQEAAKNHQQPAHDVSVEDVDDDEDDENLPTTSAKKHTLPKYHISIPVFNRDYESHLEHAECLVQHVSTLLPLIQRAANDCSSIAQKNLKWTKLMEKVSKNNKFPAALEGLHQHLQVRFGVPTSSSEAIEKVVTVDKVIPALEFVCEVSQQVASFAMEFASECGSQYASVAATDSDFLRNIEQCMQSSLASLRSVVPINTAADQLQSCNRRITESFRFAVKNKDIHDVLCDMVKTAIRNASAVVCGTVDNLIKTVMAANKICESVTALCDKAKEQALQQARRQQDFADMQEQDMDYSEEDREAIRRAREANSGSGGAGGKKQSDDDDSEDEEDEEAKAQEAEEVFDNPIDELRSKIKKLQVQLNMQQIQALQTLNSETVTLQEQIVDELKSLPFFHTLPDLLHDQVDAFRVMTGQCKAGTSRSQKPNRSKRNATKSNELQETVFSLIAEFVDGAMTSMRHSAMQQNTSDKSKLGRQAMMLKLLEEHFAWIRITFATVTAVEATASSGHECFQAMQVVLQDHLQLPASPGDNPVDPAETSASTAAPAVKSAKARLALYPDYRSKTLYFASLLDQALLQDLLLQELPLKLKEILHDLQQQVPLSDL